VRASGHDSHDFATVKEFLDALKPDNVDQKQEGHEKIGVHHAYSLSRREINRILV